MKKIEALGVRVHLNRDQGDPRNGKVEAIEFNDGTKLDVGNDRDLYGDPPSG